jgi:hypothetical protein
MLRMSLRKSTAESPGFQRKKNPLFSQNMKISIGKLNMDGKKISFNKRT